MDIGGENTAISASPLSDHGELDERDKPDNPNKLSDIEREKAEQDYREYKNTIWASQSASYQQSDNLIITISSAFLALSVSYVGNFFGKHRLDGLFVLDLGWLSLTIAIIAVLISFYLARASQSRLLEEYGIFLFEKSRREEIRSKSNHWERYTKIANGVSALFFVVGIIAIMTFAGINSNTGNSSWQPIRTTIKIQTTNYRKKVSATSLLQKTHLSQNGSSKAIQAAIGATNTRLGSKSGSDVHNRH